MKLTVGLTLLLVGCTCGSPPPPATPAPAPAVQASAAPGPVDHGAVLYTWHTRLPTGAFTGLRAFQDGAVEVGTSGPRGLTWSPLRQLGPGELALFDTLRNGPDVASLPKLIPDPSAPIEERVSYELTTRDGPRKVVVEGARRTRIPALEAVDRLLSGQIGVPRASWIQAVVGDGAKSVALPCDALSQRTFRGVAMSLKGIPTPDAALPTANTLVRIESVSLLRSEVVEVREDGALVRLDEGGSPHVGRLDAVQLATLRSALDHLPWDKAACDP